MNTCQFRTEACSLSCPCPKCREVAIHAAHVLVRFDSQGRLRGRRGKNEATHYHGNRGGYWGMQAA
jgi:hypothetical protein